MTTPESRHRLAPSGSVALADDHVVELQVLVLGEATQNVSGVASSVPSTRADWPARLGDENRAVVPPGETQRGIRDALHGRGRTARAGRSAPPGHP